MEGSVHRVGNMASLKDFKEGSIMVIFGEERGLKTDKVGEMEIS